MEDEVNRRLAQLFPDLERRYGGCEKKLAYATGAQALAVKARREERVPGLSLQVYACEYGDHWHLTSQPQTAEQRARLRAVVKQQWHGMAAELLACRERWEALLRTADALLRNLQQGRKRVARVPPSHRVRQQLTQIYEALRDDLVRLEDIEEQLTDVDLKRDQILAWADVALAYDGHLSAASDQAFLERCVRLQAEAEAKREEHATGVRRALERLEADHAGNLARAQAYLDTHYRLPLFPPEALK